MRTTYTLLAGLAAQQAAATWNLSGKPFTSPQYADNQCSDKQKSGFDWSDVQDGASNFKYGDFDFSKGWKCSSSLGKRDHLTKRTFGAKAITNKCSKQQPASFGCDSKAKPNGFSITTIDISVEFDVMIDLHYTMNDGSLCKQKSVPCKKEGSTIENTQCGGAKSVDVYLGSSYKGEKSDCQIGMHGIGFDCSPPKPYTPPSPPSPPKESTSTKATSKAVATPPTVKSSSAPVESTPAASTPAASTPAGCNGGSGEGCPPAKTSEVKTPPVETPASKTIIFSSAAPFTNSSIAAPPPTYETTVVTPPSKETSSTAVAASTPVVSPPSKESSAAGCNGGYGESCGASSAASSVAITMPASSTATPAGETSSAPAAQSSSPSYPPSSYPPKQVGDVLPSCMNTWLQISTEDCKDNTAVDCYCKNAKFTKNVIDCVQAWCETDEQTKQTLQYLVGICASYVPQNPGLVSNCPSDTFNNTPATPSSPAPVKPTGGMATPAPAPPAPGAPANTPAPAPPAASYPVTTITMGSTSLTVPAVHFTTETPVAGATPTAPVGLVPGVAPPSTPATTTAAGGAGSAPYPIASTLKSVQPSGTGALGSGGLRPSSPAQFTGAAVPMGVEAKHVMLGAALALLAL